MMQGQSEGSRAESHLLDYVRRLERNYYGWRAVHLHLSKLKPHNRRDYQLRLATSEFDGLLRTFQSDLFQLSNGDILYFWQGGAFADVDPVVLRLRYLFSDDPLSQAGEGDFEQDAELALESGGTPPSPPKFCTWFDLEREYDSFRYDLEDFFQQIGETRAAGDGEDHAEPLDPAKLARIETQLGTMDLSGLMRRQPVCAVLPQSSPQPLFTEVHVAIGELAKVLVPGVNLAGDTWLFQRLAASLDRRLLASLAARADGPPEGAISVNLRLATLLSPDFLEFHHKCRSRTSASVIIELQLIDIFAELGAYLFVREFLRERGYLVCVDGLHYLHLPMIDRKQLGADLVKFTWSPDLLDGVNGSRRDKLRVAIRQVGFDRVILCRCDSIDAVRWGQSMGIRLFQGYYIDSRLRATRPAAIAAARKALRVSKS
ncbi:MAG: hypothetical protein ACREH6_09030 [Geminicoccaceae bacterium]